MNANSGVRASAKGGENGRVWICIGVFRWTATADEAIAFARELVAAVDDVRART